VKKRPKLTHPTNDSQGMMQQIMPSKTGSSDKLRSTKLETENGLNFQKESSTIKPANTAKTFLNDSENDSKLTAYDQI
jgi:hypothetical protein